MRIWLQAQDKATTAQPAAGSADDRATDFRPLEGAPMEQFSGGKLLVEAYAAIWVILLAWIFLLWRKQASLAERLDGLEAALDRAEKRAAEAKKA